MIKIPRCLVLVILLWFMSCAPVSSQLEQDDSARNAETQTHILQRQKEEALAAQALKIQNQWIDSVLQTMDLETQIGQLFMVAAYSNKNEAHYKEVENLVKNQKVGGLIFFQGTPKQQAILTNRYQKAAQTPLLIAIDGEWGLGMRLDGTISYPRQMMLGAMNDPAQVYDFGKEIARQFKRLGIHINFAPVIDINSNPKNPVIGTRSFGENKIRVAENGIAYAKGMQHHGLIANAKHFPGHGDTDSDSHYTLPQINHSQERMRDTELYPFKKLIQDSIMSIMVAHLNIPAFDDTPDMPTTLSQKVVTDLLKKELGFEGLIFTDAMNMKGLSANVSADQANVQAVIAGNDILLFPSNVARAISLIAKAVEEGKIQAQDIENRVRKILKAKYFVGLHNYKPIKIEGLEADLNSPEARRLNEVLHQKAVTIVKNDCQVLPFQNLDSTSFASIVIGKGSDNAFQAMLSNYANFEHHAISKNASTANFNAIQKQVEGKDIVVIGLMGVSQYKFSENFDITAQAKAFIKALQEKTQVVLVVFGNAYSLSHFEELNCLVAAYVDNDLMQKSVPQVIFGAVGTKAKLPVSVSEYTVEGMGTTTQANGKLRYSDVAEGVGLRSEVIQKIDYLAEQALQIQATPGCQIIVARKGEVVLQKSYGTAIYENKTPIDNHTLYDLASLTKITATAPAIMKLVEMGKIDIDKPIAEYMPELKNTNKADIKIRQILAHEAGLYPYMPGWKRTMQDDEIGFNESPSDTFCVQVAQNLYASANIKEKMWEWVCSTEMRQAIAPNTYGYCYSDIGFYMLAQLVERISGEDLAAFMNKHFYRPMGLPTLCFKPLERFAPETIVPTEYDEKYRKTLIHATVHDYSTAILGGVSGHAGNFGNANDVAALMQLYINGGSYGGNDFLQKQTIDYFTARVHAKSRRGLGFDKGIAGLTAPKASSEGFFGHTGFTGTTVWVDPEQELIFVFLANRVYPTYKNRKLITKGIRTRMLNAIYDAMID
ncbi:MAG: serine hydrolase [Bernardetiaceae bacterium]|nr:serine hydrolase [Bernardetiaceae bacterium]